LINAVISLYKNIRQQKYKFKFSSVSHSKFDHTKLKVYIIISSTSQNLRLKLDLTWPNFNKQAIHVYVSVHGNTTQKHDQIIHRLIWNRLWTKPHHYWESCLSSVVQHLAELCCQYHMVLNNQQKYMVLYQYQSLGPTVFHGPRNVEPSCGICPLSRNFAELEKWPVISTIVGDILAWWVMTDSSITHFSRLMS